MKKVSIIVPVYNVEKYITKCLDSLINQTLKDIEVIVVNDGSPDNSQKIIDDYARKYPKIIKSYIKENGGQGSARNFGLTKAKGEYIGYVDSDDFVEKDMYLKLYNKACEGDYDIVICGNYNVSEDYRFKEEDVLQNHHNNEFENAIFDKMAVWNKIYKREVLIDNKLEFKEKVWYEDLAFSIKCLINSKKIGFVNESLYDYLIRQGSTMNNSNINRNLEILYAFDDIIKYLKENNKYEEYYDYIECLGIIHIYISTIVRVIRAEADKEEKEKVVNKLLDYINNNFTNYKNNKYLYVLTRNQKIIYKLLNCRMYFIIDLIFKMKGR